MNKSMYSNDILWYDPSIKQAIEELDKKYDNAIPVFGGALGAYNYIKGDAPDFSKFVQCLPEVADSAIFFKWHEGVGGALRRFCRLCRVDPALVECYIGASLDTLAKSESGLGS